MSYIIAENIESYLENSCDSITKSLAMVELLACIDQMPREEVEPIVHAHWIHGWSYDKCSHCGYETGKGGWPTKRCPECGAHMDEV